MTNDKRRAHISMRNVFSLLVAAVVVATTGCGGESGGTTIQSQVTRREAHAVEVSHFMSLPEMVRGTDAIIEGEVMGVAPGRVIGDGEDQLGYRDVTIRVVEVLAGTVTSEQLQVEEEDTLAEKPVMINNVEPSSVGDKGIYFLTKKDIEPYYRLVSSQGSILVRRSDTQRRKRGGPASATNPANERRTAKG